MFEYAPYFIASMSSLMAGENIGVVDLAFSRTIIVLKILTIFLTQSCIFSAGAWSLSARKTS